MTLVVPLDRAWTFRRRPDDTAGQVVDLPHTPFVADLDGRAPWFGECEYERVLALPPDAPAGRHTLWVGAAMHSAIVSVDGVECGRHAGGYLPFEIDLADCLRDGRPHRLTLRLDNRDNPEVPPGKPAAELDFCWYGGLYRGAELRCAPPLHIPDAVGAGVVAGGAIFVRTLEASALSATLSVKTQVANAGEVDRHFALQVEVLDGAQVVAQLQRASLLVKAKAMAAFETTIEVKRPRLWQPDTPALYRARVTLRDPSGSPLETATARFGIRRISFSRSGGFTINGRRLRPRGTNRHQEYPRVGYAVPPAAQRRDARRIKEAGFDYVRLSHYPQSTDFLDACDELGVLVMNCIPGWQFMGGERFREVSAQNARDLIRRDRNHPCVVLWELALNETPMDDAFMARLHAIGHEEYPGDQMFTCGWQDGYDVFNRSRQHGEIHQWKNGDKALVVAEYGDWEFYASNHGFDQKTGAGVYERWSNARQRRADGERGLRQQAHNHLVALNDTLGSPAVMDGLWSMFDYARGYDPNRAACGIMDVFRLPKFSYHFYRSQRGPEETGSGWTGGPTVFVASHWTPGSDLRVPVFTNCEEVELRLNGARIARHKPARYRLTQFLPHAPCVFELPAFDAGVLEATGYIGGQAVASHSVATPGTPDQLELEIDSMDVFAPDNEPDVLIGHARILDAAGMLCVQDGSPVTFDLSGGAEIVGPATVEAEAGIASVVLRLPAGCGALELHATRTDAQRSFSARRTWKNPSTGPGRRVRSTPTVAAPLFAVPEVS